MRTIILFFVATLGCYAATGNVQFKCTETDSGNIYMSNTGSNMFDNDFTTAWSATAANNWAGVNCGKSVTISSYLISPLWSMNGLCGNTPGNPCWQQTGTHVVEGSNNGSTWTNIDTLDDTAANFVPENVYTTRLVGATYQYFRVRDSSTNAGLGTSGNVSEFWIIGPPVSAVNAQPVAPVLNPASYVDLNGTLQLAMTSQTTSASILYTTDGTSPACPSTGTAYSGAFHPTIGANTRITIKAIACDASLSTQSSFITTGFYQSYGFKTGDVIYDITNGWPLQPWAGQIYGPVDGYYYRTGFNLLAGSQTFAMGASTCSSGQSCSHTDGVIKIAFYRSTDLYNWAFDGFIDNPPGGYGVSRIHVIWNAPNKKWVLFTDCANSGGTILMCVANSSKPNGPKSGGSWTWQTVGVQVQSENFGDFNLFVDDDGSGWVVNAVYTGTGAGSSNISKLSSDYLTVTATTLNLALPSQREAHILWKRQGVYFLAHSPYQLFGWNEQPTYQTCSCATPATNSWAAEANITNSSSSASQPEQIYYVPGKTQASDPYLFFLDTWALPVSNISTPLAYSLTFPTTTSMSFTTTSPWDLTAFANSRPAPARNLGLTSRGLR